MAKRVKVVGVASAIAVATGTAAIMASGAIWRRATSRVVERLNAALAPNSAWEPRTALTNLPPPVARYFALALSEDLTPVRSAHMRWRGEFQMRPNAGWRRFEAEQFISTRPPGFVWDARIEMMPLVPLRVRDAYVASRGAMLGKVGGLVTVVDERDTPEMAAGALARWLGETVWFPTALLPNADSADGVRWEPIDATTARATVTDGPTAVSAEFHFAPTGEITRMTAMRYRDVNGAGVLTPFEGRYRDYARWNGVLIPTSAEVAWLLPEGPFPYWRGRPTEITYQ